MADTVTANYGWVKPEVGASKDTWGVKINDDLDAVDAKVKEIEDGKQPKDGLLTAIANLVTSANVLIYATGEDAVATTPLTAFARTLLDDADAATARNTLGAASKGGNDFTGDQQITKVNPLVSFHYPNVKIGQWYLDANGTMVYRDSGGQSHFYITSTGAVWTQQLGDLNNRIENRAVAWADNRVSQVQLRRVSQTELTGGTTGYAVCPGGTFVTAVRGGDLAGLYYMYLQIYDPVNGWKATSG